MCKCGSFKIQNNDVSRFLYKILGGLKNSITNMYFTICFKFRTEIQMLLLGQEKLIFLLGYMRESMGNQLIHNYSSVY